MRNALAAEELRRAHLLLEAHGAPPEPESPGYTGSPNSRTAALARWFAQACGDAVFRGEVEHAARLQELSRLLWRCAETDGWRCGSPVCPRCTCRKAKRYRERMERRLRTPGTYALVTLTLACGELRPGARALFRFVARLRRRALWCRNVEGGELHAQVKRSGGDGQPWNVHVHALVRLRERERLDGRDLRAAWQTVLHAAGARGSAHVRTLTKHWGVNLDPRNPTVRTFVSLPAFYVTRRKPGHDLPALPPAALDEFLRFIRGQRLVSSFGSWRGARRSSVVTPQSERKSE
jgi:hypothetical protein